MLNKRLEQREIKVVERKKNRSTHREQLCLASEERGGSFDLQLGHNNQKNE